MSKIKNHPFGEDVSAYYITPEKGYLKPSDTDIITIVRRSGCNHMYSLHFIDNIGGRRKIYAKGVVAVLTEKELSYLFLVGGEDRFCEKSVINGKESHYKLDFTGDYEFWYRLERI